MWQGDELGGNIFPLGDDNFDDNGEQDSNYGNEDEDSHRNKYYDDDDDDDDDDDCNYHEDDDGDRRDGAIPVYYWEQTRSVCFPSQTC